MIVRTYTNMWNTEKKLYTIYDITLPTPVSFKQIGLFAFGAIIWMPFMYMFGVPITHWMGLVAWFSVPILIAVFGNQKLFEGKSLFEAAASMIGYAFQPKRILDGEGISLGSEKFPDENGEKPQQPIELKYVTWAKEPLERN